MLRLLNRGSVINERILPRVKSSINNGAYRKIHTQLDHYDNKLLGNVYKPPYLGDTIRDWDTMKYDLKEEIKEYLMWKMQGNWHEMTEEEVKIIYYLSYGKWGPRAHESKEDFKNPIYLLLKTTFSILLFGSVIVSAINIRHDREMSSKLANLKEKLQ